ncbi:Z1 domain-containing protein [Polynucleobacter sp. JS-Safj-400b-B2]|uniref:Z1 domain-containing protein n=1 Tax=Polynucleobacter sp. JS-Safj-400b-B2 TaxID=2576921 RepID=UPI002102E813|nr:Z1 domain-containing protein [Polynucleobacter sp. JS-Safj-400b-B2]
MTTSINILKKLKPSLLWVPEKKESTEEFLQSKSKDPNGPTYQDLTEGPSSVLQEAQRILGRCLPPSGPNGHKTGLVVGYVQSGKTMSFEMVISLARDNGYGLIIVLAGTKNNLRDQSEDRLKKDLAIDDGENWYLYSNPAANSKSQIEGKIQAWKKNRAKKGVLITVLKHGGHIDKLTLLLDKLSISNVPSLIIDDESDQASLNTNAAKIRNGKLLPSEMSATYEKICALRAALPHHSYLQYTATPQANLLLAQTDLLNASFAELVTPGSAYKGGEAFFRKNSPLIKEIPATEVPGPSNLLSASPKSLLSALRYFLLAASHHALTRERKRDRNRSMMVHPAMQTASHKLYMFWLEKSLKSLKSFVEKQYKTKPKVVLQMFQVEYDALKKTFPSIKPLSDLIDAMVEEVFGELNLVTVNGTKDAERLRPIGFWWGAQSWIAAIP